MIMLWIFWVKTIPIVLNWLCGIDLFTLLNTATGKLNYRPGSHCIVTSASLP